MSMSKALNELKTFVDLHEQAHRDANEERINVAMDHTTQLEEFPVDASAETKQAMDQILSDRGSETLQTHEATLASSAMLVEVNISNWVGRKKDKRASQDVTAQNNAKDGVASVNKALLADNDDLKAIQQHVTATRAMHANMTMPWSNSGLRLLPTAQFFKYQEAMSAMKAEFEKLVQSFLDKYEDAVVDVQLKLGDLFARDDYPTLQSLTRKFNMGINYMPLPDAGDFRVDIGNEALREVKEQYDTFYTQQYEKAMNDVWTRLHKHLTNMSERLDYTDAETKKIFRDTLVTNVQDMVELLRVCVT